MLAGEVPVIGKADPAKAIDPIKAAALQPTVDRAAGVVSGSSVAGGKAKSRKRA